MFHQTDRVYYKTTFTYYQGFQISRPPLQYYFGTTHKVLSGYDLPLKQKREPLKVLRVVITRASYGSPDDCATLRTSPTLNISDTKLKVALRSTRLTELRTYSVFSIVVTQLHQKQILKVLDDKVFGISGFLTNKSFLEKCLTVFCLYFDPYKLFPEFGTLLTWEPRIHTHL